MNSTTYRKYHALGFLVGLLQNAEAIPLNRVYNPHSADLSELEAALRDHIRSLGGFNEKTASYFAGGVDLEGCSWFFQGGDYD